MILLSTDELQKVLKEGEMADPENEEKGICKFGCKQKNLKRI